MLPLLLLGYFMRRFQRMSGSYHGFNPLGKLYQFISPSG